MAPRARSGIHLTVPPRGAQHISLGALFLASKVEECPRRVRDVLNVYAHLEQKRSGTTPGPVDIYSNRYTTLKDRLIRAEREILKELGFILYTVRPFAPSPSAPAGIAFAPARCSRARVRAGSHARVRASSPFAPSPLAAPRLACALFHAA